MGLDIAAIQFLSSEKNRGVAFNDLATLGKQDFYITSTQRIFLSKHLGFEIEEKDSTDGFWKHLGAERCNVLDNSSYEGADLLHDLNEPVPGNLKSKFSCVIDGGALEHIFNFPRAIQNCMEMVALDGHLILLTPWHHYSGHGFYQFSPELFYRTLSEENGYKIEKMLIYEEGQWFSIVDPAKIGRRVEHHGKSPTLLFISARRINEVPVFANWPQQSDYDVAWSKKEGGLAQSHAKPSLKGRLVAQSVFLQVIRDIWRDWRIARWNKKASKHWRIPIKIEFGATGK